MDWVPLSVASVSGLFASSSARWWLSGGTALDTWLGRRLREHEDIDVSVWRPDWPALATSMPDDWTVFTARHGVLTPLVNPAVQLLWKAGKPVEKDLVDAAAIVPELTPQDRAWCEAAINRAHPNSPLLTNFGRE